MDSFELNKIIGAVLGTLLFVMGVGFLAEAIYSPIEGRGPGYELPEPELTAEAGEPAEEVPEVPLATLLASASAEEGESLVSRCQSCHNFAEGAGNKQGPELYGVVGRPIGSHAGFAYSEDLANMGAAGETWTYDHLDHFIHAPHDFAPNTKMNFGGLKDAEDRANVLAYLQTLSASPVPFPEPEAAPAADAAAAPAEGAEAATEGSTTPAEAVAPADGEAVPTDAQAQPTPTVTQSETPVQGTPTTSGTEAAPPADTAPAATEAPASAPAATDAPAAGPAEGEVVPEVTAQ